jgi:hypothetical protein
MTRRIKSRTYGWSVDLSVTGSDRKTTSHINEWKGTMPKLRKRMRIGGTDHSHVVDVELGANIHVVQQRVDLKSVKVAVDVPHV